MDARYEQPIPTTSTDRQPRQFRGNWDLDNADQFRHIHCVHYETCLDDACKVCKNLTTTWVCPPDCPGRATYVEFKTQKLSEQLRQAS